MHKSTLPNGFLNLTVKSPIYVTLSGIVMSPVTPTHVNASLPIVFNPYLLAPFVLVPVAALIVTYMAIVTGFMAPFSAVQVPWTTPAVIAGFLLDGWQGAVVQLVNLVLATAIYFPFIQAQDRKYLIEERAEEGAALKPEAGCTD